MPALAIPLEIDVLIIALLGAILIWASRPLWRPLWEAFRSLPFVGAYIAARVEVLITATVNAGLGWAHAGLAPLALAIHDFNWGLTFFEDAVTHAVQSLVYALIRVHTVALPALEARMVAYAGHLYDVAVGYATYLHLIALDFARALYALASQREDQLYAQAIQHADAIYVQSVQYADAVMAQETAYVQLIRGDLIEYVNQWARALQGEITNEGQILQKWIADWETGIERWVERGLAQDQAYARALAEVQQAALAAGLSWVLVQALTAIATLERRSCMKFCEPLGDLGSLLQQVEDAGLVALLIGLTAEMVQDPRGTAKAIDELIGPTVRGLTNELAAEFGLGRVA